MRAGAALLIGTAVVVAACARQPASSPTVTVRTAAAQDVSAPLEQLQAEAAAELMAPECPAGATRCGVSPPRERYHGLDAPNVVIGPVDAQAASVEQRSQGRRPALVLLDSFDGHGFGTSGPHGQGAGNNPSDNSLAVGPNHVMETVNSRIAIYTKKGKLYDRSGTTLFGPLSTNVMFVGFGGECERAPNGDAVVRYDQLANRWLIVMPLFRRRPPSTPGGPQGPYGMCYAVSTGENPLGPYHRYYFERELFPDYPRPAIWPDGYYIPTSTGDNRLPDGSLPHKHACVLERDQVLRGLPAREQCVISRYSNFYNNADIDGPGLPPRGAPNIMMSTGGAQLDSIFQDDGIYYWKFYVDWKDTTKTRLEGPHKIAVARYNFMCNGQLTRCVPQPGTDMRLDSQGDKIMSRMVYRNVNGVESIVAVHSVNTDAGAGGVRWYEFRMNQNYDPVLHQQGTYAPDSLYRWMASPAIDRQGNIGIGYSFGGPPHYAGQRFSGRLASDSLGQLTFHETILVEGKAAQTNTLRWQDYVQTALDPDDDCTIWYVGDYLKEGARSYTARIGAFRLPDCLRASLSGSAYFDVNHNGFREPNEAGLPGWPITYAGARMADKLPPVADTLTTDASGAFSTWVPADAAYYEPSYSITARAPSNPAWGRSSSGVAHGTGGTVPLMDAAYHVRVRDREEITQLGFGFFCTVPNVNAVTSAHWLGREGRDVLRANEPQAGGPGRGGGGGGGGGGGRGPGAQGWRGLINTTRLLVNSDGSRVAVAGTFEEAYVQFSTWLRAASDANPAHAASAQLITTSLNVAYGAQDGNVTVLDPVSHDWVSVSALLGRVSNAIAASTGTSASGAGDRAQVVAYLTLLRALNENRANVTPTSPARCPQPAR